MFLRKVHRKAAIPSPFHSPSVHSFTAAVTALELQRGQLPGCLSGPLQKQLADPLQVDSVSFLEPDSENFSLEGQFCEASEKCINGEDLDDWGLAQGRG